MTRRLGVAVLVTATALAATTSPSSTPAVAGAEIVVTRDALTLPRGCTPRGVAELLVRFFDAFNAGDAEALEMLVAPAGGAPPAFTLFAFDGTVLYERARVVSHLLGRQAAGVRLRLLAASVERTGRTVPTSVDVNYRVERPDGVYLGKGLVDCATQRMWQGAIGPQIAGPLVLPCPRPPVWSLSGPAIACTTGPNARALASGFTLGRSRVRLPASCAPARVRKNLRALLVSLNAGHGDAVAQRFARRGLFHPYTASSATGALGRRAIARFVRGRYAAGDGWTATVLAPPRGRAGLPREAVYGLRFAVVFQGAVVKATAEAKLVVECQSGLLRRWVGPAMATPGT